MRFKEVKAISVFEPRVVDGILLAVEMVDDMSSCSCHCLILLYIYFNLQRNRGQEDKKGKK